VPGEIDNLTFTTSDILPRTSCGFYWKEGSYAEPTSGIATDGMASLSVSLYGVGYLGQSAWRLLCRPASADFLQLIKTDGD
jgi:hypothetical protein